MAPSPSPLRDAVLFLAVANQTDGEVREIMRRGFIRAGFALLEHMVWTTKQIVLEQDELNRASGTTDSLLSEAERGYLEDTSYKLKECGKVATKREFPGLVPGLKLTLRCLSKVYWQVVAYAEVSSVFPFDALERAKRIRDRITHPKDASDLAVSDADIEDLKATVSGLHDAFQRISPLVVEYDDGSKSSDPVAWEEGERLAREHAREALVRVTARDDE